MVRAGIVLAVAGAILRFAVTAGVTGLNLDVAGDILLIAGAILAIVGVALIGEHDYRDDRDV